MPGSSRKPFSSASCLQLSRLSLEGGPEAPDHTLETPHSPLYADPYTPPANSHHKITDVRGLDEVSTLLVTDMCPQPVVCLGRERLRGFVGQGSQLHGGPSPGPSVNNAFLAVPQCSAELTWTRAPKPIPLGPRVCACLRPQLQTLRPPLAFQEGGPAATSLSAAPGLCQGSWAPAPAFPSARE